MERLTKYISSYAHGAEGVSKDRLTGAYCRGEFEATACVEKLAEYEDLDEQGLLLKLPAAIGDTVYAYCGEFGILPYTVDCIVLDEKITYQCSSYSEPVGDCPSECLDEIEPDISEIGKTVFLTQSEAEEALKRMERDNVK